MQYLCFGQGDYAISLLSDEEFVKYRSIIPIIDDWWWLLPPTIETKKDDDEKQEAGTVKFVNLEGDKNDLGWEPSYRIGVRPVIRFKKEGLNKGEVFSALGNRWVLLDKGFAISLDTIGHRRIDANVSYWEKHFKTATNRYCELKPWLEDWGKCGESD